MITMERQDHDESPRVLAHGHLALLDWERATEEDTMTSSTKYGDPVRRSPFDRIFDMGLLLLVIATIGAVGASLAHL